MAKPNYSMKNLLLLLPLLFIGCSNFHISKTENFIDNRWLKDDPKTFTFSVDQKETAHVELKFSHVSDPQYTDVPLEVTLQYPSGKKETLPVTLHLVDSNGKALSECAGDVCDLTQVIKENVLLEKGDYTFTVKNNFAHSYLPNALAVGIALAVHAK
jgi:hypothetical protein